MLKTGGADMRDAYGKVIESFFWACKANKQTICNGVVPEDVLVSVKDPKYKAWRMKLSEKEAVDPASLVDELPIVPQTALQMLSLKPDKIFEIVEGELQGKSAAQVKKIKNYSCRSQALAHQHAVDATDHLTTLTNIVSIPITLKLMSATM